MAKQKHIYKTLAVREDERRKLKEVLEALGESTVHELLDHALLKNSGISTRSAGQHLKYLAGQKIISPFNKHKKIWSPLTKRAPPKKKNKKVIQETAVVTPEGMFFVLNITDGSLMLDIGGLRLPVQFEES